MPHYYDLVLALIPVSLAGVAGLLVTVGLPMSTAIPLGAPIPIALIGHALFVNSPIDRAHDPARKSTGSGSRNGSGPGFNAD